MRAVCYNIYMAIVDRVRYLFTPHSSNNHKARVLHSSSILLYISFFVFLQISLNAIHKYNPAILGYATNINVQELVNSTNTKRQENGLEPVILNDQLSKAAYSKAFDMFNKDYWAHDAPDGTTPWKFVVDSGYSYIVAGENLAKNFNDSNGVVEAWMNSPTHKDNILRREYKDIGFAVVDGKLQGEETTLIVQFFGTAKGEVPKSLPTTPPLPVDTQGDQIETTRVIPLELAGVKNDPLVDIRTLEKQLSLFALVFLIGVLFVDGYFVYKHKKVRIAGRNWAHIIFLLSLLGIIYFTGTGAIL
jgi:uncharacterized protein YkwD